MKYLGKAYEEADVQVGDVVKAIGSVDGWEHIATVVDPRNIKDSGKNLSGNCNYFVYLIIQKVIKGNYPVGDYDGWPSTRVVKLDNQNKTNNFSNNCPECNTAGEYINGAFKCPLCWKVW